MTRPDLDIYLTAIAAGDPDAFGLWVAGAERPVRESLRALAAQVDTEAIVQETLLRTWQVAARVQLDGRPNCLLRLGIRIARNLALDVLRRTRGPALDPQALERVLAEQSEPEPSSPPDPMLRRAIADCHDRLPHKPLRALDARLASAGGEPDETLAEREGMRLNTFLQNFTRARKLLADCLRAKGIAVEHYA